MKKLFKARSKTKPKTFTAKQDAYLKSLNSHVRLHLCLTPKQVKMLVSSLRSTAGLRGEKDRQYLKKILKAIEEQAA